MISDVRSPDEAGHQGCKSVALLLACRCRAMAGDRSDRARDEVDARVAVNDWRGSEWFVDGVGSSGGRCDESSAWFFDVAWNRGA